MAVQRTIAVIGALVLGGCVVAERGGAPTPPKKISLRFCWATADEKEGYQTVKDEGGQPLHVAAESFLTEADIEAASAWHGAQRTMILLEFKPLAKLRLAEASATHVGDRLAVFVDDRLVMSPVVRRPITAGKVYLNGGFSTAQSDDIVRRLSAVRATTQASNP
jgi:preprotein translocase subunit SecD